MQGVSTSPLQQKQYGRAGYLFNMQGVSQSISCSVDAQGVYLTLFTFVNAGLPDYPALVQSGTVMNEDASTGTSPVPVRNKGIPCGAGIRGLIPVRNAPGPD